MYILSAVRVARYGRRQLDMTLLSIFSRYSELRGEIPPVCIKFMLRAMFGAFTFFCFNHVLHPTCSVYIWDARSKSNVEYRSKSYAKSFISDNIPFSVHIRMFLPNEKSSV